MFKNNDYLLYTYTSGKTGVNYFVLSTKTWDRYITFNWDLSQSEVEDLIKRFETTGLEYADFQHTMWSDGDILRNLVSKKLELLSC